MSIQRLHPPHHSTGDFVALDVLVPAPPLSKAMTCGEALGRMLDHPEWPCLAVVDEKKAIIGLLDRAGLLMTFARPLLRDLYSRRSVTRLMQRDGLVVDVGASLESIGTAIANGRSHALHSGFGITDSGVYAGIGTGVGLVDRAMEQTRRRSAALEEANRAAEQASRSKSTFLANMSHEIRTPLNGVLANLELLRFTPLSAEQGELIHAADVAAQTLLRIIGDVLDFSKIEAGKLTVERIDTAPADLIAETVDLFGSQVRQKGLDLTAEIGPGIPRLVRSDPLRIRQVLINLCGNALKFTQAGGIHLTLDRVPAEGGTATLRFAVHDTGIGFDAGKARQLFEAFTQADESTTRRFGGSGLGLAISKRLVELMGGTIGCEGATGQGASFWFTVPAVPPDPADADAPEAPPDILGCSVLLVTGDRAVGGPAFQALTEAGARIATAASLADGLSLYLNARTAGRPFEAVIIDHALPDGAGLSFAESVTEPDGRLIALVPGDDLALHRRAYRVGFRRFLAKPLAAAALCHAVAQASRRIRRPRPPEHRTGMLEIRARGLGRRAAGKPILVLEDNAINQAVARRQLDKLGLACAIADNGRIGLEMVQSGDYALVLADCQMPEMDGFEFVRHLRRLEAEQGGHRPVVAMTANALQGDAERCRDAGMDDYLAKPVSLDRLAEKLDRWLPADPAPPVERPGPGRSDREAGGARPAIARPAGDEPDAVIDLAQLAMILGDDDDSALGELLGCFADALGPLLDRLAEALARRDRQAVRESAHAIKGMARNAAAGGLAGLIAELEAGAAAVDWPVLDGLATASREAAGAAEAWIRSYRARCGLAAGAP